MRVSLATFLVICLEFLCYRGLAQSNQCKENEEYQECAGGCPLTCQNYREPNFCTVQCKSGCFCRPGYVKGPGDKCIRPSQCPIGPCKDGEIESTCMNPCNNCIQKGKCYFEYCIKGCDCRPGYYRNSTGTCVIAEKCGSETHLCPPNEHYKECANPCNDCWSRGHCSETYCQPGCDCNPGYFRDDYGTCVPEDHCENHDASCGANEIVSDCVNSCNDCEHKGHCYHDECHYGCDCKSGFFRNHDGLCISESECAAITCGHYEEYSECGSACPISCNNYNKQIHCTLHCVKGCFCSRGYIKGPDGTCIKPNECPRVCGEYEEYSECGTSCPLHCSNITTSSSTPCPTICAKGCFCKAGYVRGPNGKCILQNYCPPSCGEYEEFRECGPGCINTCENRVPIGDCSLPCAKGCFCTSGYIRGPNGKCILPESCPPVCGKNEEYRDCGSACPANCTNPNTTCREVCVRGCFCKPGYIKDPYGVCVLPTNCPLLCDEKEIFMSCGPRCEPSCDAIHRNPALCPGCQKGCFCKPGYVRGPGRKCILPISCPAECHEYEEFKECGSKCPPTCADRYRTCTAQCVRGCFCKPGYFKDPSGKCVLPSQCPETCPENQTYRLCGTNCPITCHNIGKSITCRQHCVKGCFCNDGYVKGPNGTCITPELCPMRCHEHEVLTCSSRSCEGSCDDVDDYSRPCIGECTNGCYCRRGFVRTPDGKCVQRSMCPRINRFDGRNKGDGGEENDTATSSSNPVETKSLSPTKSPLKMKDSLTKAPLIIKALLTTESSLTTQDNLDLLTKLDETLPNLGISLPIVGTLLDEVVSTPADVGHVSVSTAISATKETSQMPMTNTAAKSLEKPTTAMITESPQKSSEKPTRAMITKSSKNPMMDMGLVISQTPIQFSITSEPTEFANTTELESSTLSMNMDSTSTISTMNGTTA